MSELLEAQALIPSEVKLRLLYLSIAIVVAVVTIVLVSLNYIGEDDEKNI